MSLFSDGYLARPVRKLLSTAEQHYRKRRFKREREQILNRGQIELADVVSRDAMYTAYRFLREHGGKAPGVDGFVYSTITPSEMGDILEQVAIAIQNKTYRSQPTLEVRLPKRTAGFRTLKIGVILDRIVARALYAILEPVWDRLFLKRSFGFRMGKSALHLLAQLQAEMEQTDSWVLAIDDVKNAFDNVRIEHLIRLQSEAQQQAANAPNRPVVISEEVMAHAINIARHFDVQRISGIDQGGNYSPIALNLILHFVHDLPLSAAGSPSWFRYADNLAYLVPEVSVGQRVLSSVANELRNAGLSLKGMDGVTDLRVRGSSTELLGFRVSRSHRGQLAFSPGAQAHLLLSEHLLEAHESVEPEKSAMQILSGWINAYGPACQRCELVSTKLLNTAAEYGFRELSRHSIEQAVQQAWKRWRRLLQKTRRHQTERSA